jgi:CRP/FNR family cyclic AMP-dependent transcriptional regulator
MSSLSSLGPFHPFSELPPGPPRGPSPPRLAASERERLVRSPLFSHLAPEELERLIDEAGILRVEAGDTIFRRGDAGDRVLFLLSGEVTVEAGSPRGGSVAVNRLGPGELLGEMAVLQDVPRSATVTASADGALLAIEPAAFLSLLVGHPALGIQVLGSVTQRLRRLTDRVGESDA